MPDQHIPRSGRKNGLYNEDFSGSSYPDRLPPGDFVDGPRKITYTVPAQAKGTYEFICDPHAEFMRGTFIVG